MTTKNEYASLLLFSFVEKFDSHYNISFLFQMKTNAHQTLVKMEEVVWTATTSTLVPVYLGSLALIVKSISVN